MRERMLLPIARHEAAHCVAALELGLEVAFVAVEPRRVTYATEMESMLYSARVLRGEAFPRCLTRLAEDSYEQDPQAVLAAMCAPSYMRSGSLLVDAYARWERRTAVRFAAEQLEPLS